MASTAPKNLLDDEIDVRPVALTRMLILGNPNLTYNAEDWNKTPNRHQICVERMAEQFTGIILDGLVKKVRERYKFLDELPTRYGIAFCAAYYLRRCEAKERRDICPEYYFYSIDDRFMFIDLFRGARDLQETATELDKAMQVKGFGRTIKAILRQTYDGRSPKPLYDTKRPYEKEWKDKVFVRRSPLQIMTEICANTCAHGWTHQDVIKLAHFPSLDPWNPNKLGAIFTMVGWYGARKTLSKIDQDAPAEFLTRDIVPPLIKLLRAVAEVKASNDPTVIAEILKERPDLCKQLTPAGIVPLKHYKDEQISAVFTQRSPLRHLFHYLPSWTLLGYFEPGKQHLLAVAERLRNPKVILDERLSPAEILMAWLNYERYEEHLERKSGQLNTASKMAGLKLDGSASVASRKRKHELTESVAYKPSTFILDAFSVAFASSIYLNFWSTVGKKRFFIVTDVRPAMECHIFGAQYLKGVEAVSCVLAIAVRNEQPHVQISAFTNDGVMPLMDEVKIAESVTIQNFVDQFKTVKPGPTNFSAVFTAARGTRANFFIIITDRPPTHKKWFQELRGIVSEYMKSEKCPDVKVAVWFVHGRRDDKVILPLCDDVLVINGWNCFVPEVIWSFARGELDEVPIALPEAVPGE